MINLIDMNHAESGFSSATSLSSFKNYSFVDNAPYFFLYHAMLSCPKNMVCLHEVYVATVKVKPW